MKKILLSATALVALSATAFAADLPSRVAAPSMAPPVFTWTGLYVGASVGIAKSSATDTEYVDFVDSTSTAWTVASAANGVTGGVNVGYNWQTGALVFGLEADIAALNNSSTVVDTASNVEKHAISSLGTVRARAGYAIDRALLYVTGGLAYGYQKDSLFEGSPYYGSVSGWKTGWTLGGGIEYAITPNWTVRAEALYVDLGKKSVSDIGCDQITFKTTATVARVGVNYKF